MQRVVPKVKMKDKYQTSNLYLRWHRTAQYVVNTCIRHNLLIFGLVILLRNQAPHVQQTNHQSKTVNSNVL